MSLTAEQEEACAEVAALMVRARRVAKVALVRTTSADRPALSMRLGASFLDEALALLVMHGGLCARHLGEVVSIRLAKAGMAERIAEDCGESHDSRAIN